MMRCDEAGTEAALRESSETVDELLEGRLRVLQKKRGYRFSLDAILLAHFIRLKDRDAALEFGAGSAVISLILARRSQGRKITGIEIQSGLADMARRSVLMNGLEGRVEIVCGDVRDIRSLCEPQSFRVVFFNPPYRRKASGRINPRTEKALARHEIEGSLRDFLAAAKYVLKEKGAVFVVYPAERLVELLHRMRLEGLEPKQLRMVHTKRSSEAVLALVEGIKGGGEELKVLPALFIYHEAGGYTEEMAELFREISCCPPSCGG